MPLHYLDAYKCPGCGVRIDQFEDGHISGSHRPACTSGGPEGALFEQSKVRLEYARKHIEEVLGGVEPRTAPPSGQTELLRSYTRDGEPVAVLEPPAPKA